ncbi:MAG TPA: GAF domain-containing sensor histidine kinase [Chthonomonadales bacterium]|nr:GAF domain-containing sensor histidine kinase [Chthonomonadales bacterium]
MTGHDAAHTPHDDGDSSLAEQLEIRDRQLQAVRSISEALYSIADLDTLLRQTLRVALSTVGADAGSILLFDAARSRLVFRHVVGKEELIGREIDPAAENAGKAAEVFRTGSALITADVEREGHDARFDDETGYHTRNMLTVPLRSMAGEAIGVMQALNKAHGAFNTRDLTLLEIVGGLAATSIVNARLAEEAQLAAITRAVGDLGHDIKNALTPVQTMMETAVYAFIEPMYAELDQALASASHSERSLAARVREITAPLKDFYPEVLESVGDGCADIREMVSEIADYAKGTQAVNLQPGSIEEVLRDRLKRLRTLARNRNISLELEVREPVPLFRFDNRLVGRAVFNLVNNAIGAIVDAVTRKAAPMRPYHITLRASACAGGAFPEGGYCLIEVEDDGPGIAPRIRELLFTARAVSTTAGGTGIGTRFVKNVADAHGGEVGVESEEGAGALFWMKLPLRAD